MAAVTVDVKALIAANAAIGIDVDGVAAVAITSFVAAATTAAVVIRALCCCCHSCHYHC